MANDAPLVLVFDPQTVDHLGAKMYSHLPNALAELVANAYDADATKVLIQIGADGTISVIDNGHGMSRAEVADRYLHIGRNRRMESGGLTESGKRQVSGKKGLGKLALFGIGRRVEMTTTRAGNDYATRVTLSYDDMMRSTGNYHPGEKSEPVNIGRHGTRVRLSQLKRSSPVDAAELAKSLSRLFNYMDRSFELTVEGADSQRHRVTAEARLGSVDIEFEWRFPECWRSDDQLGLQRSISGHIVSSATPLRQGMRGITLYVNGRLANEPEYFGASESSYAYSYLTGYLNVDYLDGLEPDVIATDRRSLDWGSDETLLLRGLLQRLVVRIGRDWRERRAEARRKVIDEATGGTDEWVDSIRADEREAVREIVAVIESDTVDISVEQQGELVRLVQRVAPPHAEYVWRHLHPEIQNATESYYRAGDFYTAVDEAIKRYVNRAKKLAEIDDDMASAVVSKAFGDSGKLKVFAKYASTFTATTARDIERGQQHVSMGIVAGFRNPFSHEEIALLHESGAFTYNDCLDALSIVSHLMRRLEDSIT